MQLLIAVGGSATEEGLAFAQGPCTNHDPGGGVVHAAGAVARAR